MIVTRTANCGRAASLHQAFVKLGRIDIAIWIARQPAVFFIENISHLLLIGKVCGLPISVGKICEARKIGAGTGSGTSSAETVLRETGAPPADCRVRRRHSRSDFH